jgi:hypothetical protein
VGGLRAERDGALAADGRSRPDLGLRELVGRWRGGAHDHDPRLGDHLHRGLHEHFAHPNFYPNADSLADPDALAHRYADPHADTHSNADGHVDSDADGHIHRHTDDYRH